jgi:hypothetical protein
VAEQLREIELALDKISVELSDTSAYELLEVVAMLLDELGNPSLDVDARRHGDMPILSVGSVRPGDRTLSPKPHISLISLRMTMRVRHRRLLLNAPDSADSLQIGGT